MKILKFALITLPLLLVLDYIWIGLIAGNFYKTEYGALYTAHPVWDAAIVFYIIYALALAYFVVIPAFEKQSWKLALGRGAFLALAAFGTYDLTSLAITVNWPPILSIVDMSWGVFEGGLASVLAYFIASKIIKR
jgi:uncharacterized membrane protein